MSAHGGVSGRGEHILLQAHLVLWDNEAGLAVSAVTASGIADIGGPGLFTSAKAQSAASLARVSKESFQDAVAEGMPHLGLQD